jgi:deoxyribodipyrimidine photo-lyase
MHSLRLDPDGAYVGAWVSELARLPSALIHAPWTASPAQLEDAGVRLGTGHPRPCVDHALARACALEAYGRIKAAA